MFVEINFRKTNFTWINLSPRNLSYSYTRQKKSKQALRPGFLSTASVLSRIILVLNTLNYE